ncbi:CPBP family intramembrane glutamic endopeptidase [Tepidibacillus sp. LV47]|uniref:CPBP family intramembrane glutamic endopeptidase n=1 Tax=Tepidibacillus sp. LV47 TaxID=3398228 RepID=UPI003AAB99CC
MPKLKKISIEELDTQTLLINLYLTQFITLMIGFLLYYFIYHLHPIAVILQVVIPEIGIHSFLYGCVFSLIVILIDLILTNTVPKEWIDDGGINEKIFSNIPIWQIGIIALIVSFSEELLFRGVLQSLIDNALTSFLFTMIHFRYLKKWILTIETFLISLGLGFLLTHWGWFSNFIAHFLIDLLLGILLRREALKKS